MILSRSDGYCMWLVYFLEYSFLWNGSFTPEIYYAIAITIMFKNGLCAHFCDFDFDSYSTHRKISQSQSHSSNTSQVRIDPSTTHWLPNRIKFFEMISPVGIIDEVDMSMCSSYVILNKILLCFSPYFTCEACSLIMLTRSSQ